MISIFSGTTNCAHFQSVVNLVESETQKVEREGERERE